MEPVILVLTITENSSSLFSLFRDMIVLADFFVFNLLCFFQEGVNLYDLFPWTAFTTSRFILLRKLKIKKKIERDRIKPDVKDKKKK
jgi:hypothetical protein